MEFAGVISAIGALASSPWVWLILFASLLYAAGNYIDELLLSKYEQEVGTMVLISTLFGGIVVILFACVAFFTQTSVGLATPLLLQALLVGVLEALWVIPYLYATERSGAIVAGPLFQAVPVFALTIEYFLGVIPPAIQIVGVLIVVLGGVLVSIEREEDEEGNTSHSIDWGTMGLMTIAVVMNAFIYVLFRDAALSSNFVSTGFWVGLGTLITGIAIYLIWRPYREEFNAFCGNANYKTVGVQFINEIFDAGGVYMSHLATTLGPSVMVVTAFNATQPIFIGIIGIILSTLGIAGISTERAGGGTWKVIAIGIALIAIGVITIALGSN